MILFSTFHFPNSGLCMASWTDCTSFLPAYQHQHAPLLLAALKTKLSSSIASFMTPILASHPRHSRSGPLHSRNPRRGFLLPSIRLCVFLLVRVARQEPPVVLKPRPQ